MVFNSYPARKKSRGGAAAKLLVKILVGGVILTILAGAAGVAYTWYNGNQTDNLVQEKTPEVDATKDPVIKPTKLSPDAKVGASIQSMTTPVAPGENTSVTIKTNPDSKCLISVMYNNVVSKDSGLGPKQSNNFGNVTWTWTVENTVPFGKYPIKVTCIYYDKSAVVIGDLEVAKPAPVPVNP